MEDNKDYDQVTLTLDDDTELVCDVLHVFTANVKNEEKTYIALLPEDADEDAEIYIYRFEDHGGDDIDIINIEDDEEFEIASDAYDELLDNEELDEMLSDDPE